MTPTLRFSTVAILATIIGVSHSQPQLYGQGRSLPASSRSAVPTYSQLPAILYAPSCVQQQPAPAPPAKAEDFSYLIQLAKSLNNKNKCQTCNDNCTCGTINGGEIINKLIDALIHAALNKKDASVASTNPTTTTNTTTITNPTTTTSPTTTTNPTTTTSPSTTTNPATTTNPTTTTGPTTTTNPTTTTSPTTATSPSTTTNPTTTNTPTTGLVTGVVDPVVSTANDVVATVESVTSDITPTSTNTDNAPTNNISSR